MREIQMKDAWVVRKSLENQFQNVVQMMKHTWMVRISLSLVRLVCRMKMTKDTWVVKRGMMKVVVLVVQYMIVQVGALMMEKILMKE
jgi:hypothetical protein